MFSSTPALLLFNLAVANVMADVDLQAPVSPAIDLPLANALQNVDRKVPLAEANGLAQVPLVRVAELQPPAQLENVARQFVAERSPREIRPPDRLFDRYTSSNIDGHKRTSSARKAQRATRLAIRESASSATTSSSAGLRNDDYYLHKCRHTCSSVYKVR